MRKTLFFLLPLCMVLLAASSGAARQHLVIPGTGDSQELLRILAEAFEAANPGKKVDVPDSVGSGGGIKSVARGKTELGRVARPIKNMEKKYNLSYKVFAYSPIVFVTNPSVSGMSNISFEQIIGIYSGQIATWEQLGAKSGKIYVANREAGDSSRTVLEKTIPGFKKIDPFAGEILYTTPETARTISNYQNTIGYLPLSMVTGTTLTVLKLNTIEPSIKNIQNDKYPLVTPLGIVWKEDISGLAKEFFDFLFRPQAKKIIIKNGAVPAL